MANQSPDRRRVLEMLAKAAAASQFTGFARWTFAGQAGASGKEGRGKRHVYHPQFFTPAEYESVEQLSELIIPADDTPGARDAGVAEFIDFMAMSDQEIQPGFRNGLRWVETAAKDENGSAFIKLPEERQVALLRRASEAPRESEERRFFGLIRQYTVMGYYTSRIGLEQLDFPGLKMYAQSPSCPHVNDREHLHLRRTEA